MDKFPIPRWQYRFDNFSRALKLLEEAILIKRTSKLNDLEKEGLIQRFGYIWELTWKLLKDYLEHEGVVLNLITPTNIIKEAIGVNLINDGEIWMSALNARNKMSHTNNQLDFAKIIDDIDQVYLQKMQQLHAKLSALIKN